MIKFKRILRYLFYTIKENRGKTIMLLCAIALLYPIFNCNYDLKEQVKVITSFKYDTNTCYVYYGSENSFSVLKFDKEQPISPDGYLTKDKDNFWLILSWIGFVVLCIILLVATFQDDDDANWEFTGRWADVLHRDIVCEFEDDIYYYILDNKLLCKSDTQLTRLHDLVNRYIKYPNLFIEFKGTKQKKRNNKLEEILSDV
jgi:hypothetical protein